MPEDYPGMKMAQMQGTGQGTPTCAQKESTIDQQFSRMHNAMHDLEMQVDLLHGDLVICTPMNDVSVDGPPKPIGTLEQELSRIVDRIVSNMDRLRALHANLDPVIGRIKILG
jgi:hypothetical protein